jgi:transcriptional regulator of heat shock response
MFRMDKRKEDILLIIIKEHIKTGAPVGSNILVENYKLGISPATVRNEMAILEEAGFIKQPHTSAGRIPTERAYEFFLEQIGEKKLSEAEKKSLNEALAEMTEADFRNTAKLLAKLSDNAVFWAFYRHNVFYTGVANLLKQPEFREINMIYDISSIIDRMDEIIDRIFNKVKPGTQIMIGSKNPFSDFCSSIVAKYQKDGQIGLFGIMAPLRMDYSENQALVKYIYGRIVGDKIT